VSHSDVALLLPWYVNATLSEEERRAVDDHLAACAECAREVEELGRWQGALREVEEDAALPHPSSLVRVHEAIERRRGRWPWLTGLPPFARLALAAQLAVILGLAALLIARGTREPVFQTVASPAAGRARATLVIGFAEGASEAALRRTLAGIEGTIVAGPSASGLYTVEVPVAPERDEEIERLLRRLREDRAVVRLAARRF
jgi:anti-sigma factor RsiW